MKIDYLIVGNGLAGIMLCETLRKLGKSFRLISDNSQQASIVASGLYNPVVLKRFNKAWNADKQLPLAMSVYENLESFLKIKIDTKIPIYRVFRSEEEQNNWFISCDSLELEPFLTPRIIDNHNKNIKAPFGYGIVRHTGRIDTRLLLESYYYYLNQKGLLIADTFDYNHLDNKAELKYKDFEARQIIFAEGFGMKKNPFFNKLPLQGTKGELLVIRAPDLKSEIILKSSIFVIPIIKDEYLVGSTYAWNDYSNEPTQNAKIQLLDKLKGLISCDFDIVQQRAGIRPTVPDRRPLVGQHGVYKNIYILNGLGSRGVLIAPTVAKNLIDFIELGIPLDNEVNIKRFK